MPKRSSEEKLNYYQEKIRKLQKKQFNKKRRCVITHSSSDSEQNLDIGTHNDNVENTPQPTSELRERSPSPGPPEAEPDFMLQPMLTPAPAPAPIAPDAPEAPPDSLDSELLDALGDATEETPMYGSEIHSVLAQRWLPILKKGLHTDLKEKLLKDYAIPENCKLLKAPSVNPELRAAITDIAKNRDKKIQAEQDQLGLGMTAINRAMSILLTQDNKIEAVRILSDGCRILSDLHFTQTQVRKKLLTRGLDKNFLSNIQDQERDETLFGKTLSDKIKESKAIEKQSKEIKKDVHTTSIHFKHSNASTYYKKSLSGKLVGPSPLSDIEQGRAQQLTIPEPIPVPRRTSDTGATGISCSNGPSPAAAVIRNDRLTTRPDTTLSQQGTHTRSETIYPGSSSAVRTAFSTRGTPRQSLDLIMSSISKNTLNQYNSTYKAWWQFCHNNSVDPYRPSLSTILLFLTEQFNKGVAYGSMNNHRSALSLLLGSELTDNDQVKRLLRGAYKLRPATPKYSFTWNPQVVLDCIASWVPNKDLSLEKITKKLLILLALSTAHRVQTLSLIKIENIKINSSGVQIGIVDIIKTSAAGREQPVLFLPYFSENKSICPATTLQDYLTVTKDIRPTSIKTLILTFKRPHKPASSQTLSRWIKQVLGECGVDINTFSAHSTRHAATSTAHASGVSLDTIRKTAGWTENSRSFAQFYNRQIITDNNFARSVLITNPS